MKRTYNPAKRNKVLIIDDDQRLADIYGNQLPRHGFEVEVAGSSSITAESIADQLFELVVLDFSFPGTGGVEILKKIRTDSRTQALPIIVLSNPFRGHLVRAAREGGATRCVTKAECTRRDFLEIVREVLTAPSASIVNATPPSTIFQETATQHPLPSLDATFLAEVPEVLANLRVSHYAFANTDKEDLRRVELCEMRSQLHFLAGLAGLAGFYKGAQMASALEALLIDLHAKPRNIKPSVIQTIAQAVERLGSILDHTNAPSNPLMPSRVLVVDNEIIARKTVCSAMAQTGLFVESRNDFAHAQRLLEKDHFDLIFLGVEMPGLDGLELCDRIRRMPAHRSTPIVFVTAHSGFQFHAQSILAGGTDLIAKPFISVELAVKALTWLFENPRAPRAFNARKFDLPEKTKPFEADARLSVSVA